MKLRTKTATILSGTIAALALLSYLFARFCLLTGYENQEKEYAYQNVQRAIGAVEGEFREIRTVARENAARDDAYAFFANPDPHFLDRNSFTSHKRWKPWDGWPAESRTISITCSESSLAIAI